MPPNLGQFLVPGMRAAGRFACVSCSSDRETAQLIGGRFSTTEIGKIGALSFGKFTKGRRGMTGGGVRGNVLDASGPALEV